GIDMLLRRRVIDHPEMIEAIAVYRVHGDIALGARHAAGPVVPVAPWIGLEGAVRLHFADAGGRHFGPTWHAGEQSPARRRAGAVDHRIVGSRYLNELHGSLPPFVVTTHCECITSSKCQMISSVGERAGGWTRTGANRAGRNTEYL